MKTDRHVGDCLILHLFNIYLTYQYLNLSVIHVFLCDIFPFKHKCFQNIHLFPIFWGSLISHDVTVVPSSSQLSGMWLCINWCSTSKLLVLNQSGVLTLWSELHLPLIGSL